MNLSDYKSKKMIITIAGLVIVGTALFIPGVDQEMIKWFGGFVAGIVASFNVSQGVADGLSRGNTTATSAETMRLSRGK